jgi:D-alanyl-D-alanine carboxypeptidase/D-alanyl-D-alanine-endopeptidase (penicillin-binding protein 4)
LILVLAPPAVPAAAAQSSPLAQLTSDILSITQSPGVRRGQWGIVVESLNRSERLFERNPDALLVPASVLKLLSVASAVDAVGWDYRFETSLRSSAAIIDGVLKGDLVVVGAGDPSIGGPAGDDLTAWVDALAALGIKRIDGRVVGDDDAIEEPRPALSWGWDDLGYRTGAIFGALNFAQNRMTVRVVAGRAEGAPTSLVAEPLAAYRALANRTVTGARGSRQLLWPEQRPGEAALTIAGSIPAGAPAATLTVAVGNPTLWFAHVLRERLIARGIDVSGAALDIDDAMPRPDTAAMTVLYRYRSHPLAEIVEPLMKESINVYGEALLRLNAAPGAFPTNDAALDGLRLRLAAWGVPADSQQLVDGSGLSRRDTIAPDTLLAVLKREYDASGESPWMKALPVAGVDGSLETRLKGTAAERNVRAKTGTMSNIRSLAGYVTTRDGEHLAFVIMVNNFEGAGAVAVQAIDAIAVRLAGFSR